MANRRRINISIDELLYDRLTRIKKTYGFKNVCELSIAALNILAGHIEKAEQGKGAAIGYDDEHEAIEEMFSELANWERKPDGTVPKRDHKPNMM
jgi:hypothetical protein